MTAKHLYPPPRAASHYQHYTAAMISPGFLLQLEYMYRVDVDPRRAMIHPIAPLRVPRPSAPSGHLLPRLLPLQTPLHRRTAAVFAGL